jgi:hypothetical protein
MSTSPNSLATVLPGSGTSFSVHASDLFQADLQHTTVTLTAAQIIAMYATPVLIAPVPQTGVFAGTSVITVQNWLFTMTATSTAFTGGGAVNIQYGNTGSGGGTAIGNTMAASVITTGTPGTTFTLVLLGSSNITLTGNAGIYITNASAPFAAGTGTAVVDFWYSINQ